MLFQTITLVLATTEAMSQSTVSFLGLPAEISMSIIEKLEEKDRKSLASLNKRLFNLDIMTGQRRFESVQFQSAIECRTINECTIIAKSGGIVKNFDRTDPIDKISAFCNKAKTELLIITGQFNETSERMLQRLMKIIEFNQLVIDIVNEQSILCQLVENCKQPVKVIIRWKIPETIMGLPKKMILNLPDIVKHNMAVFSCNETFVDDEIFLDLIRKSSGKIFIDCQNGSITIAAIKTAFEMISSGTRKREIIFCVDPIVSLSYCFDLIACLDDFDLNFYHRIYEFTHKDSGAGLRRYNENGHRLIFHMYPPQK